MCEDFAHCRVLTKVVVQCEGRVCRWRGLMVLLFYSRWFQVGCSHGGRYLILEGTSFLFCIFGCFIFGARWQRNYRGCPSRRLGHQWFIYLKRDKCFAGGSYKVERHC
jgi:hypothetical protein